MVSPRSKLFILVNILSIIRVSLLETVHFTNSPNKILQANNYTTYKVEVPNGNAITIIEANTPLIDKNIKFNHVENAAIKHSIHHKSDKRKQVEHLETSLSMTVTPNNNYNDEYENSAALVAVGGEESVTNDFSGNLSPERNFYQHKNSMKTVYSPELLQKFLKDYANKVHSAAISNEDSHVAHHSSQVNVNDEQNDENENNKYESMEAESDNEDGNRRVSISSNDDDKTAADLNDIQQRKNYRPNGNYNHPYNKNSGWVTLDAVPYSKSKVSKWQSNANKYGSQSSYNYQNNNQRPSSYRPSNNYDYDYNNNNNNNDNEDYYAPSKPSRPTYQNNQFYNGGSSSGSSYHHSNNKPPQDNFYQQSAHHHSSQSYNYEDNQRPPSRPYHGEIITDNRPSNFPSHGEGDYHKQPQPQPHSHNRPQQHQQPPPYNEYSYHGNNNNNNGGGYYNYKDGPHPQTYPTNGDGEWVLVSTTKGYQFPKRSGQRAMSFVAQNGLNGDVKYTDNKGIITAAGSQQVETVIRPHRRVGPTKMTQQQVKLTVLPLYANQAPSNNQNYDNDVNMSVYRPSPYDGIIETEQTNQTVEESAANASESNASKPPPSPLAVKKKRKVMKNYLMRKSSSNTHDSSAVIAAVGASLLPASLGLLAPMVLGK